MRRFLKAAIVVLAAGGAASAGAESIDLVVGERGAFQHWTVSASVDGQSLLQRWSNAVQRLSEYCDLNGSGALDATEAARLPSAFAIRQMLWGQFLSGAGSAPPWEALDADRDGRATSEEVAAYYQSQGLGGLVFSMGHAPWTEELSAAILKRAGGTDVSEGSPEKAVWQASIPIIHSLDVDGDELISPAELLGDVTYPGTAANVLVPTFATARMNPPEVAALPLAWFSSSNEVAEAAAPAPLPKTEGESARFARIRSSEPDVAWQVTFNGDESTSTLTGAAAQPSGDGESIAEERLAVGGVWIQTAANGGRMSDLWRDARGRFEAQFQELAQEQGAFIDAELLKANTRLPDIGRLLSLADRDVDGRLTRAELDRWLALQDELSSAMALVSVVDYGAGLFEFIDQTHDGLLSKAELAGSWQRLEDAGCVRDGKPSLERLPRQIRMIMSRGLPTSLLATLPRRGPKWFQGLDRNGDGIVSKGEFPWDESKFELLDKNGDGGIDADESAGEPTAKDKAANDDGEDDRRVDLGRHLFFDASLSSDGSVSCASCHQPAHGWSSPDRLPHGVGGHTAARHAPSLYNVGLKKLFFWDGRAASLEEQAIQPIENPLEMNQPLDALLERLRTDPAQRTRFEAAGMEPTSQALAQVLAAYCRTIVADDAPFDRFRSGALTALSPAARRGHDLFFFRLNCSACHSGPQFTDGKFHNLGVGMDHDDPDLGRFLVTGKDEDRGAFKTPSLRNVAKTAPYMHDGRFETLEEVLDFYVQGGHFNPELDQLMNVFPLSADEKADLATFLREGLTSEKDPAADAAAKFVKPRP